MKKYSIEPQELYNVLTKLLIELEEESNNVNELTIRINDLRKTLIDLFADDCCHSDEDINHTQECKSKE